MKKGPDLAAALCANYCAYYKPGKSEEIFCEGFAVVRRLIERGRMVPLAARTAAGTDSQQRAALTEHLCRNCSFRDSGCDFISTGGAAAPCGGFVLLSRLLHAGDITIEEIH